MFHRLMDDISAWEFFTDETKKYNPFHSNLQKKKSFSFIVSFYSNKFVPYFFEKMFISYETISNNVLPSVKSIGIIAVFCFYVCTFTRYWVLL